MQSKKFHTVKKYYDKKLWGKSAVHAAVEKGWITAEEYEQIVGEPFEEAAD